MSPKVFYRSDTACHKMGGEDSVQRSGRSAGARLHEVPGLTASRDGGRIRWGHVARELGVDAPGAQGGNRDGTAAGVGGGFVVTAPRRIALKGESILAVNRKISVAVWAFSAVLASACSSDSTEGTAGNPPTK